MTRRQRQSTKRLRDKLTRLERLCDSLAYELRDAADRLHAEWYRRESLEAQNRALMDPIVRLKMLEPSPPIIVHVDKLPSPCPAAAPGANLPPACQDRPAATSTNSAPSLRPSSGRGRRSSRPSKL